MKTATIDSLKIDYTDDASYNRMTYILMPFSINENTVAAWCSKSKSNLAIVTGFDWQNDLTPWPAPAVPKGTGDFQGRAQQTLKKLQEQVIPQIETAAPTKERNLIGVSLSGLFAMWAWMQDDIFTNVCSLSGSFWYEGFVKWLQNYHIPKKKGAILFELGTEEPKSKQPVFATVGTCTEAVVAKLKEAGINVYFQWVPGTHYSPIEPRLQLAFKFLGEQDDYQQDKQSQHHGIDRPHCQLPVE